jgi:two-component system, OmpR family, sensor histidine kinase KdpD
LANLSTQQRGKLFIFLGYAPGVGKTHRMLSQALNQRKLGKKVVVAYVKLFSQAGYKSMLEQLTSPDMHQYQFDEDIDTEMLVAQNPHIVLVDDIHERITVNARHYRRYQIVEALLNAGIDVFCTLNVHHIESLNDVIEQTIGFSVEETVPDRLIDYASDIELVDTAIQSLLTRYRLRQVAPQRSYKGNHDNQTLLSLRQLTVRHISQQISTFRDGTSGSIHSFSTPEKLMVCISSSPLSAKLVRSAYRLAKEIHAEWSAVYVEGANRRAVDEESQKRLIQVMHLVEELGGKVVTIHGHSISETLMRYAQHHGITRIIIGHSTLPRWRDLFRGSVVNQLIKRNKDIDIHVVNSGLAAEKTPLFKIRPQINHRQIYIKSVVSVMLVTIVSFLIAPLVFPATLVTLYLLTIMFVAGYLGYRPAIVATVLSVVSFLFLFIPSPVAMGTENLPYIAILVGLSVAGITITRLVSVAIERANVANRRADQIMELYSLSRDLSTVVDLDEIVRTVITHITQSFQADAVVFLPEDQQLSPCHITANFPLADAEKAMVEHVYTTGESAGFSITKNTDALGMYLPLRTAHQIEGVIGVILPENRLPTLNQHRLLDAFANQAALAIGANRLIEQAHNTRLIHEREKLQSALLDSISHDLRTPLVSIAGALSSLRDESTLFDAKMQVELIDDAWSEAERLNRLVENLLEMSRLQSGELTLNRDWHDLGEIIAVARSQLRERLSNYQVMIHVQPDVSLIYVDFTLMVQVLVNLLDNAAKYSPEAKPIELCAMTQLSSIVFQVADSGSGIPEKELPHIFNKFYRASNVTYKNGTGLGLSICSGIVEAHNGTIRAFNRPEGGAVFEVRLPKEDINS